MLREVGQKPNFHSQIKEKTNELMLYDKSRTLLCKKITLEAIGSSRHLQQLSIQVLESIRLRHKYEMLEIQLANASESLKRLKVEIEEANARKSELKSAAKKYLQEVNSIKNQYADREEILSIFESVSSSK